MGALFMCVVALLCLYSATSYDVAAILENVPDEERTDFIRNAVDQGYKISTGKAPQTKDLNAFIAVSIYNHAVTNHQITDEVKLKEYRDVICFDDGTCVNIGDVGIHPFTK